MIFTKKALLGSLSFATVLMVGNWSEAIAQTIQDLPNGYYAYRNIKYPNSQRNPSYFLFRKSGDFAAGTSFAGISDGLDCWQGDLKSNYIVNKTDAFENMGRGTKPLTFTVSKRNGSFNLEDYQRVSLNDVIAKYQTARQKFQACLNLFPVANASSQTPNPQSLSAARYPTDAELTQLKQDYERVILPLMIKSREFGRNAEGEHSPSLNLFANEWAKINPNLSPFLGSWQKQVASLMIYPSKTSKNACVVMTLPARGSSSNSLDAQFAIASFSDGQLRIKTSGWFNNFLSSGAIFVRRGNVLAIATIEQNKPKINPYSAYSDPLRNLKSLPLANTAQNQRVQQQFYAADCTASLPSQTR